MKFKNVDLSDFDLEFYQKKEESIFPDLEEKASHYRKEKNGSYTRYYDGKDRERFIRFDGPAVTEWLFYSVESKPLVMTKSTGEAKWYLDDGILELTKEGKTLFKGEEVSVRSTKKKNKYKRIL